ncbi:hypothetical protein Tco_0516337 [Tanacetum coccineum]
MLEVNAAQFKVNAASVKVNAASAKKIFYVVNAASAKVNVASAKLRLLEFGLGAKDQYHDEGLFRVSPLNESMLQRETLLDIVGTSGCRYGVLQSFPVERIEQGNE